MASTNVVRVGTRGSALALRQTEQVIDLLRSEFPRLEFATTVVRTHGDANANAPLAGMGLGVFVKEIEQLLLSGDIDLAVHSLKDMPTLLPPGLTIGAVLEREDPRDVQVNRWGLPLAEVPEGSLIGTSSPRRGAQLRLHHPGLNVVPLRGNVETRLRKSEGAECDGAILAAAGLSRLGLGERITEYLPPTRFVPPPGQGALAVETRDERRTDAGLDGRAGASGHPLRRHRRAHLPGSLGRWMPDAGGRLRHLRRGYAGTDGVHGVSPSGDAAFHCTRNGPADDPTGLAAAALAELTAQGAERLLGAG